MAARPKRGAWPNAPRGALVERGPQCVPSGRRDLRLITPKTLSSSRVIHGLLEARRSSPSECRDFKVMQLGGIHRIQLAHVPRHGTALEPHHASAIDLGNRSGFENEVAIGKDLGDFRHDSCGEGVFALEFTLGSVPVGMVPAMVGSPWAWV